MKTLTLLLVACLFCACPSSTSTDPTAQLPTDGPPIVAVSREAMPVKVMPFGINLCQYADYGTGQIRKNLISRNPGFEGWEYRSIVEVAQATLLGFKDVGPPGAWMDGFWNGAEFEVIWGQAVGKTGRVSEFKRGEDGCSYTLDRVTAFAPGDQVVLRVKRDSNPAGGWWPTVKGKARLEASLARPGSQGRSSVLLDCLGKGEIELHSYFDPPTADVSTLMPLRGRYVLSFWAKSDTASLLQAGLKRLTTPNRDYFDQSFRLSSGWQQFRCEFEADDDDSQGVVDLCFTVDEGQVHLDDVALYRKEGGPDGFDPGILQALAELKPGIVRAWGGQLGQSLDNLLAGPESRCLSGYSRWSQEPKVVGYSLHEVLSLCESLKCEAWYVLPLTLSPSERAALIQYLCGDTNTPMGQLRERLGHPRPWNQSLSRIHLEFGNEAWNGIFKGGCLERPEVYGGVCANFAAQMRALPGFDARVIDLVVGGQAVNADRNKAILAHAGTPDTLAIAPYVKFKFDQPIAPYEPLVQLAEEVERLRGDSYLTQNLALVAAQPKPPELAVYEVNLHTTEGSAAEHELNQFVTSAAAASSLGAHMLNMMQLGIARQCFYTLNQFDFKRGDQKNVRLWGVLRELREGGLKRPSYLVLRLLNQALRGELVKVAIGGTKATFGLGQTQVDQALLAYCTREQNTYRLIVINLDPGQAQSFQLRLPGKPAANVTHDWLKFDHPFNGNEAWETVNLARETLPEMPKELQVGPSGVAVYSFAIP